MNRPGVPLESCLVFGLLLGAYSAAPYQPTQPDCRNSPRAGKADPDWTVPKREMADAAVE